MRSRKKELFEIVDFLQFNREMEQELFKEEKPKFSHEFDIESDKPIVVIFSSDVHFGSIYTDLSKLRSILEFVFDHPSVYLAVNGDYIDNFELPVPKLLLAGINSQIIPPAKQRMWYEALIDELSERKKLIGVTIGNHDEFYSNDFIKILLSKDVPISQNRMLLKLKVGSAVYKIGMVHKSRFNSSINPIHASLRELQLYFPTSDVIVTSHTHLPSMAIIPYPGEDEITERILIKTGTLKNQDPYTFKFFNPYPVSHISTPAVVFYPDERRMIPFFKFEDAISFIDKELEMEV